MVDNNGGLIALGMLSGNSGFSAPSGNLASGAGDSTALRKARKLFTTPATKAPWRGAAKAPTTVDAILSKASTVRQMHSIIDMPDRLESAGSDDVETTFITYRALDRLNTLARAGQRAGLSDSERQGLQRSFAKGLAELQTFLAGAAGQKVNIAFGPPSSSVKSAPALATQDIGSFTGKGLVTDLDAQLPGLSGTEKLSITLDGGNYHDVVTVDLSTLPQVPPTLGQVAKAINDAIATNTSGHDYKVKFAPARIDGKYGLSMSTPGTTVSVQQVGAGDALEVVASNTQYKVPGGAQVSRIADPAAALDRQTLGAVTATDRAATAAAQAKAKAKAEAKADNDGLRRPAKVETVAPVNADLKALASATSSDGFTYVVGTTRGDIGTSRANGNDELFLSKVDSNGSIIWQHALGSSGDVQGAAISLTAKGEVVVAGTVSGAFEGQALSGSSILVTKFAASGDRQFATVVPTAGNDQATAVAAAADGSFYIGGRAKGDGGAAAYLAHMDANGKFIAQRTIDTSGGDRVDALAVDGAGNLLALTRENGQATLRRIDGTSLAADLGSVSLGGADARALAVAADGSIAVVGATSQALPGGGAFVAGHGSDAFVTRVKSDLSIAGTTYLGGEGEEQADSVAFVNGAICVGGRTTGNLDGDRRGTVDGFVARFDASTGTVGAVSQFGVSGTVYDPVLVSAAKGGNTSLAALGLRQGALNGEISTSLAAQFGLTAGDSFKVQLDNGASRTIKIAEGETVASLRRKIQLQFVGDAVTVTSPRSADGTVQLSISVRQGHTLSITAGPKDRDVLAKLGLAPTRLHSDPVHKDSDLKIQPGGSYGLALSTDLNIGSVDVAKAAGAALTSAISMTQTAYRSLYWDSSKAARLTGNVGPGTAQQQAQIAQYKLALSRLNGGGGGGSLL